MVRYTQTTCTISGVGTRYDTRSSLSIMVIMKCSVGNWFNIFSLHKRAVVGRQSGELPRVTSGYMLIYMSNIHMRKQPVHRNVVRLLNFHFGPWKLVLSDLLANSNDLLRATCLLVVGDHADCDTCDA